MPPYDPLVRHKAMEKLVVRNVGGVQERKYWRFRFDRWYGGIVTADTVGCGLACKFCWVSDKVMFKPAKVGKFYSPSEVADRFVNMARKRGLGQLRVGGGEPTIGKKHLLELLRYLAEHNFTFVLETNGILIGSDHEYAEDLSKHPFVHVRVSLKGCNQNEFVTLTGGEQKGFTLQLKALENLMQTGVSCHPAVMTSFSTRQSLKRLLTRLRSINSQLSENLEIEKLILYPHVKRKIRKYGLELHMGRDNL